jgi:carbonic anhydrase/acetyltransferase-like protein (isoleucine patch superfamily)
MLKRVSTFIKLGALRKNAEVRINGVVHIKTVLAEGETVPIGWVAVGSPARIFPPHEHDKIWEIQGGLDFPMTVYGVDRNRSKDVMGEISEYMVETLSSHFGDQTEPDSERGNRP